MVVIALVLVSRKWKNGSNSSYNRTPFLHSLLTKGKFRVKISPVSQNLIMIRTKAVEHRTYQYGSLSLRYIRWLSKWFLYTERH